MTETKRELPKLQVLRWDGEQWPEKRISISTCDGFGAGSAIFISARYADLDEAEEQADEIARRCNVYKLAVEQLREAAELSAEGLHENAAWKAEDALRTLEGE